VESNSLKWLIRHRAPALVIIDIFSFQLSLYLTYYLRFQAGIFTNPLRPEFIPVASLLTIFWLLLYSLRGIYKNKISISRYETFAEVTKTILIGAFILFFISMDPSKPVSTGRFVLLTYATLLILTSSVGHAAYRTFIRWLFIRNIGLYKSVIVGFDERGQALYQTLDNRPEFGHNIVGVVRCNENEPTPETTHSLLLDNLDDYLKGFTDNDLEYVLIAMEPSNRDSVMNVIDKAHYHGYKVMIVPDFFQILIGLAKSRELYGVALLEVFPDLIDPFSKVLKRISDVVVGLIVLTLGLPFLITAGILVKLDSKGPMLYRQKRVGYRGKEFYLYKFRSMRVDAEAKTGAVWATENDPRVTRLGNFLRKYRIDELPQAWNILIGNMSLVGPRPERKVFVDQFIKEIPFYSRRLNVKPGITGWAQVRYGYDATVDDVKEKLKYDLFYLENLSIGLDIKILLNTLWVMVAARGQ
jgi:exopolysaccharide biosynthesis polyprenyl glycosylphosphotransferase